MVLREVLAISAEWLLLGYGVTRLTIRFVESFLFGLSRTILWRFAAAIGIPLAALAAGYLPAWKASRVLDLLDLKVSGVGLAYWLDRRVIGGDRIGWRLGAPGNSQDISLRSNAFAHGNCIGLNVDVFL